MSLQIILDNFCSKTYPITTWTRDAYLYSPHEGIPLCALSVGVFLHLIERAESEPYEWALPPYGPNLKVDEGKFPSLVYKQMLQGWIIRRFPSLIQKKMHGPRPKLDEGPVPVEWSLWNLSPSAGEFEAETLAERPSDATRKTTELRGLCRHWCGGSGWHWECWCCFSSHHCSQSNVNKSP